MRRVALTPSQKTMRDQYRFEQERASPRTFDLAAYLAENPDTAGLVRSMAAQEQRAEVGKLLADLDLSWGSLHEEARARVPASYRDAIDEAEAAFDEDSGGDAFENIVAAQDAYEDAALAAHTDLVAELTQTSVRTVDEVEGDVLLHLDDFIEAHRRVLTETDSIHAHRIVALQEQVDPREVARVGRFWTTERDDARPFLRKPSFGDSVAWLYEARIPADSVDVAGSLGAALEGLLHRTPADQTEVRLYRNAPVWIGTVEIRDERHGPWKNKKTKFAINAWRRA